MTDEKPKRGPGRPTNRERRDDLQQTIEKGLRGLAELLERRDELEPADSIAAIIRRDADRMAESLAAAADQWAAAERAIRWLFDAAGIIGFAGAFGPLLSRLIDRVRLSGLLDFNREESDEQQAHVVPTPV